MLTINTNDNGDAWAVNRLLSPDYMRGWLMQHVQCRLLHDGSSRKEQFGTWYEHCCAG